MNESEAENVVEEINIKSIQDISKQNDTFSNFQGSIEINMFSSKFNNMLNNNENNVNKLLNNEEINFSKMNVNELLENKENELNNSVLAKNLNELSLDVRSKKKKLTKNMSLEMIKKTDKEKIENNEKKKVKSMRSKKFLIPIDPNLYKVDMEEVKKKFFNLKYKKRNLERLNSSKSMDKTELMTNISRNEEKSLENRYDKTVNNVEIIQNEDNLNNHFLSENINYLKNISNESNKIANVEVITSVFNDKSKEKSFENREIIENEEKEVFEINEKFEKLRENVIESFIEKKIEIEKKEMSKDKNLKIQNKDIKSRSKEIKSTSNIKKTVQIQNLRSKIKVENEIIKKFNFKTSTPKIKISIKIPDKKSVDKSNDDRSENIKNYPPIRNNIKTISIARSEKVTNSIVIDKSNIADPSTNQEKSIFIFLT